MQELKSSLFRQRTIECPKEVDYETSFRVMSFNINCETFDLENGWERRKDAIASMIRFHRIDLAGLQEPLKKQLDDLDELLYEFDQFGIGLEDGYEAGSFNAILFRRSRYELLNGDAFFLSPTPDEPSLGWNSRFPRGATWVYLLDRKTKESFYVFNTHFDYHSRLARDESAFLLREKIEEITNGLPVIVTGDFNLFPELGGEETYYLLTDPEQPFPGEPLIDAQTVALFPHHGPTGTWSGYKEAGQPGIKPDYIFVDSRITVYLHGVLSDTFDGRFPSDHLPVVADLSLKP